jgi:Tfp pilus assembly protein PilN
MSTPIQLPVVNFSRDLRAASRAAAVLAWLAAAGTLIAIGALIFQSQSYREARERMVEQAATLAAETQELRQKELQNPGAAAIGTLRQRIAALNSLDFAQAPGVIAVLSALEQLMPGPVALQNLDYDRNHGALDLAAVSASSDELTAFFDAATKSPAFKSVRLIDKKQASAGEEAGAQFQVRLSITPVSAEPRV